MSKQAVDYLLSQLERAAYVERRSHPEDLRSKRVVLTRRGTSAIRVMRDAVSELEKTWAQQLGQKRFGQLGELLVELNKLA